METPGVVVADPTILVQVVAAVAAGDAVPVVPTRGHAAPVVVVHVLADQRGLVALLLQPGGGRGFLATQLSKPLGAPQRGPIAQYAVVVGVLAAQGGRPAGAAQGVGHEGVLEGGTPRRQLPDVGVAPPVPVQEVRVEVVCEDQDDVRAVGGPCGLARKAAPERQGADPDQRERDQGQPPDLRKPPGRALHTGCCTHGHPGPDPFPGGITGSVGAAGGEFVARAADYARRRRSSNTSRPGRRSPRSIACISSTTRPLTGVSTPCSRPRPTTAPFMTSTSVLRPRSKIGRAHV